jgi:hypothetical protein
MGDLFRALSTWGGKSRFGAKGSVVVKWPQAAVTVCPDGEGSRTQNSMIPRFQQVASESEKILEDALKGEEPLGLTGRFESAHLPFPWRVGRCETSARLLA